MDLTNKKILLAVIFGFLLLTIPLTVSLLPHKQEIRSNASASTSLAFTPDSSTSNPIQKNTGDAIPLDIMVDPGKNMVTFVRLQVKYDNTKLVLTDSNAFTPNTAAFPTMIEGPVNGTGTIALSISVGSDPTKAIQKLTRLGTLNFKAIGSTGSTPTQVTYTSLTQALSAGHTDQAAENILSTTTPANITITGTNITPSITPNNSPTVTPQDTGSPTPTPSSTILQFSILLHGIGAAGDNPNPQGNDLSNKNPLHPQRNLTVQIFNSQNQQVTTQQTSIIFNSSSGDFAGTLDLGTSFPTGNYTIKVQSDKYLRKLVSGVQAIENMKANTIPQTALVAGDVNIDNTLNILDYNILLDCGYGALDPLPMADPGSQFHSLDCTGHKDLAANTDLDDNGIINSADYNLWLRELSVQNGD